MTTEMNKVQSYYDRRLTHFIEDDFHTYVTADLWTLDTDVDGTAIVGDHRKTDHKRAVDPYPVKGHVYLAST